MTIQMFLLVSLVGAAGTPPSVADLASSVASQERSLSKYTFVGNHKSSERGAARREYLVHDDAYRVVEYPSESKDSISQPFAMATLQLAGKHTTLEQANKKSGFAVGNRSEVTPRTDLALRSEYFSASPYSPVSLIGQRLSALLLDPNFKGETSWSVAGSEDALTLTFSYDSGKDNARLEEGLPPLRGSMQFRRASDWRLVSAKFELVKRQNGKELWAMPQELVIEYARDEDPIPQKASLRSGKDGKFFKLFELESFNAYSPTTDDFTLAHFGIKELDPEASGTPTPWFLYAGITAGAIILLVVLLGLWQKRMQAKAA